MTSTSSAAVCALTYAVKINPGGATPATSWSEIDASGNLKVDTNTPGSKVLEVDYT